MPSRRHAHEALLLVLLLVPSACRSSARSPAPPVTAADAAPGPGAPIAPPQAPTAGAIAAPSVPSAAAASTGPTGTIRGRVRFRGTPPAASAIDQRSDPVCARHPQRDEAIIVGRDGGLHGVRVRLLGAFPAMAIDDGAPGATLTIRQQQCAYRPRVAWVRAGGKITVENDDPTLHNVRAQRVDPVETLLNVAQIEGAAPIARRAPAQPGWLTVKCDVHPWMVAYVWVSEHPFVAVSDDGGGFTLAAAPAGHHTLEAWHEALGVRTVEVDVPAGGEVPVEIVLAR